MMDRDLWPEKFKNPNTKTTDCYKFLLWRNGRIVTIHQHMPVTSKVISAPLDENLELATGFDLVMDLQKYDALMLEVNTLPREKKQGLFISSPVIISSGNNDLKINVHCENTDALVSFLGILKLFDLQMLDVSSMVYGGAIHAYTKELVINEYMFSSSYYALPFIARGMMEDLVGVGTTRDIAFRKIELIRPAFLRDRGIWKLRAVQTAVEKLLGKEIDWPT